MMATHATRVSMAPLPDTALDDDEADEKPTPVPVLEKLTWDPVVVAVPPIPVLFLLPMEDPVGGGDVPIGTEPCDDTDGAGVVLSVVYGAVRGSIFCLFCLFLIFVYLFVHF